MPTRLKLYRTVPVNCYWNGLEAVITSLGSFEDTVKIKTNLFGIIEVYLKELEFDIGELNDLHSWD